jgi:hypothetical protein
MKNNSVYRVRFNPGPVWPHRKGLRAPAVHLAARSRGVSVGGSRGDDRAAQAMGVVNKTTVH